MRITLQRSLLALSALLLLLPANLMAGSHQGYVDTINWWQSVRQQMVPYGLQLQQRYAQTEATAGVTPSKVNQEFNRRLAGEAPGSFFNASVGGAWKVNSYTSVHFSRQWEIHRLTQQFGDLTKLYDFKQNTLTLTSGANRISLKLDMNSPGRSAFGSVVIPAVAADAAAIYRERPQARPNRDGLPDIVNDAYLHQVDTVGELRMDQFAERLMTDIGYRHNILFSVKELYQDPTQKIATGPPGIPVNVPFLSGGADREGGAVTPVTLLTGAFALIPWYAYVIFFGIVAVSGVSTTRRVKRYSRGVSLLRSLIRYFMEWNAQSETPQYDSRGTLNSPAEQKFLAVLEDILDPELYVVNCKKRLADILKVRDGQDCGREQAAFNRISRKHVDFVIN